MQVFEFEKCEDCEDGYDEWLNICKYLEENCLDIAQDAAGTCALCEETYYPLGEYCESYPDFEGMDEAEACSVDHCSTCKTSDENLVSDPSFE